ncbi:DUF6790 family protein [Ectobacillus panaciterrae]|uniref:DUF6790 family protein n=1 Tax=Ectobacillus panaciterrae TaxID=363872 RepID=UPI000420EDC3|nr:DUF6790 family protein [Ectobacillus panaciterrae]
MRDTDNVFASMWFGFGHLFHTEMMAKYIGWSSNLFQKEVGYADFALGVLGVLSVWLGCGFVHIGDIRKNGNHSPGNGLLHILRTCFSIPAVVAVLLVLGAVK